MNPQVYDFLLLRAQKDVGALAHDVQLYIEQLAFVLEVEHVELVDDDKLQSFSKYHNLEVEDKVDIQIRVYDSLTKHQVAVVVFSSLNNVETQRHEPEQ